MESLLAEDRRFPPPPAFAAGAWLNSEEQYQELCRQAEDDREGFWAERAQELLTWDHPWDRVLTRGAEDGTFRWFDGARINASANCIDRHLEERGDKTAIIWEGEPGDIRRLTYRELHREVQSCAAMLQELGITSQDVVTLYMPLVPELLISVLACARLGAMHNVVFAGFSAEALGERIRDCDARLVITADGGWRRGKVLPLKDVVDQALTDAPSVSRVVVLKRTEQPITMTEGRDVWWHELMAQYVNATVPAVGMDAEHPLFLLYTSGSTGKPKGILHTTGGYLLGTAYTSKLVFDLQEDDIFWCTADVGWITGHSYVTYGPLSQGATVVIYEGAPNAPDWRRFWQIIERHQVTKFYTAPTAIRSFMAHGPEQPQEHDLSSLRLLGTVGEPINPAAWSWYHEAVGGGRCPIVDTWWQTETGAIMIAPLPGLTTARPGSATRPLPGISPQVVDGDGHPVPPGKGGYLVVTEPWPSMLRTIYGDPERYRSQYWERFPGRYFTGDGARQDDDGNFWIMGRVDDVINVSGHRLSTMEIESALVSHPAVTEAAVVGVPDELKGESIAAFVTLGADGEGAAPTAEDLQEHVCAQIGALARPGAIRFTPTLPKTRSGKIMRRLLRDIARGQEVKGDLSTMADREALSLLI